MSTIGYRPDQRSATARLVRLLASLLLATPLIFSVLARAERLPVRIFNTEDGMWSSSVEYLMRDSHHFMWFCTRDGLSRFDGYRFINYRVGNRPSPYINYLYETRDGRYWVALNAGGLYRFDPEASNVATASDDGRRQLNAELVSPAGVATLFE